MTLALGALATTACRPAAPATPEPAVSALLIRNASQFDVNVYALPTADAKPVWLATVPAAGSRSVSLTRRVLQGDGNLVVRTQAIGAAGTWTSGSVPVNRNLAAALDLFVNSVGNCSESHLYPVDVREVGTIVP
jgi:hypothetical protein